MGSPDFCLASSSLPFTGSPDFCLAASRFSLQQQQMREAASPREPRAAWQRRGVPGGAGSLAGSRLRLCLRPWPGDGDGERNLVPGSRIWPSPQPQPRAGCFKPSACRRWPLWERMSPAQSRCPASLQKLELQIHNSSGTPWLFASCCEQMEELQIKPSAAREPIAFPTQPRRQQQRQRREKKNKKKLKKKKRQKEREKESAISTGAELPSQHTYVRGAGTLCWRRALPGDLDEGSALPPPRAAWRREAARVGGDIGTAARCHTRGEQAVNADQSWQRLHSLRSQRGN